MNDTPESPIKRSDEEWKKELPAETFSVMRKHGTERAGTSPLNKEHRPGMYACAACGFFLFGLAHEIRQRHRLAELLRAPAEGGRHHDGPDLRDGADRSSLRPLWRAFGACVSRRPRAHRRALLYERRGVEVR